MQVGHVFMRWDSFGTGWLKGELRDACSAGGTMAAPMRQKERREEGCRAAISMAKEALEWWLIRCNKWRERGLKRDV